MHSSALTGMVALVYVALTLKGLVDYFLLGASWTTIGQRALQPEIAGVLLVGLLVGIGLIREQGWAWMLGLLAVGLQLFRALYPLWPFRGGVDTLLWNLSPTEWLLFPFLLLLIWPSTRRQCLARDR